MGGGGGGGGGEDGGGGAKRQRGTRLTWTRHCQLNGSFNVTNRTAAILFSSQKIPFGN